MPCRSAEFNYYYIKRFARAEIGNVGCNIKSFCCRCAVNTRKQTTRNGSCITAIMMLYCHTPYGVRVIHRYRTLFVRYAFVSDRTWSLLSSSSIEKTGSKIYANRNRYRRVRLKRLDQSGGCSQSLVWKIVAMRRRVLELWPF